MYLSLKRNRWKNPRFRILSTLGLLCLVIVQTPGRSVQTYIGKKAGDVLFLPVVSRPYPRYFLETFDGNPNSPQPWQPEDWDVTVHSRGVAQYYSLEPMHAGHGSTCEPPPKTHSISTYEQAVFLCRDHMMTAINDGGYGVIYLTPNAMLDFSAGEAVIRFNLSTARTSLRDWIDIWITPYDDHLQLPLTDWLPDLSGEPNRAITIRMDTFNGKTIFRASLINKFNAEELSGKTWIAYEDFLTPSATRRDMFELRLSKTHFKFGMPGYNHWWYDTDIPTLSWSQGVVQFGHHSYTPTKDCSDCGPNTWHWDNVEINPATFFSIRRANQRYVDGKTVTAATLDDPAPTNALLRFAGIGKDLEVSYNAGKTWQPTQVKPQEKYTEEAFWSYWTPIPAGADTIHFRGKNWWGGDWFVRDISIWVLSASSGLKR